MGKLHSTGASVVVVLWPLLLRSQLDCHVLLALKFSTQLAHIPVYLLVFPVFPTTPSKSHSHSVPTVYRMADIFLICNKFGYECFRSALVSVPGDCT